MNELTKFYRNKYNANNKKGYSFNDITKKWDDYKLEVEHDYIQWVFPDETGGINKNAPKLTKKDIKMFKTNTAIRKNVVDATLRMLLFYGFVLDKKEFVKQIKPVNRRDRGRTIGLFAPHNFKRLTRIMDFLTIINMEFLSSTFFLALCHTLKSNSIFLKKVLENKSLKVWMSTQNSLVSYVHNYEVNKLNPREDIQTSDEEIDDWEELYYKDSDEDEEWANIPSDLLYESDEEEKDSEESEDLTDSDEEMEDESKTCGITGLDYIGNSCYMDSALICTFAMPNKAITDNILKKDLTTLKTNGRKLWSHCGDNIDNDIKKRQAIQKSLNGITESMRGKKDVKKCSNLRSLIRKCPGSQPFHGTDTQDSGEFLAYIFSLFQVDVAITKVQSYGSNSLVENPDWTLVRSEKDKHASPIIDITSTKLQNIEEGYDITKAVKQTEDALLSPSEIWTPDKDIPDVRYSRRKEVSRMKSSPLVIFNLVRTYGEAKFKKPKTKKEKDAGRGAFKGIVTEEIFREISAPENMKLKGKQLNLTAIVVHTGGAHYIANFKCNDEWYWYDDNPGESRHEINHVGSYKNMLKTDPNPMTHGTLFFYT